jgi:hypothetical protein
VLDVGRDIERIRDYLAGRLSDEESEASASAWCATRSWCVSWNGR